MLFLANKSDVNGAFDDKEVAERMQLNQITDRPWHIQSSSALKGTGVNEGISWLSEVMKKKKK